MSRKIIGYNVYRAADGSALEYYGFARTIAKAKALAKRGRGLEECLWDTARAAGHCGGMTAPDQSNEADQPAAWFGRGGHDCAVAVYGD